MSAIFLVFTSSKDTSPVAIKTAIKIKERRETVVPAAAARPYFW